MEISSSQLEAANARLQAFGQVIGLPSLHFDEDGECCLSIDNNYKVLLTALENQILMECKVGTFDELLERPMMVEIARSNYRWKNTRGSTLAANTLAKTIHLFRAIDTERADPAAFSVVFEQFLMGVEYWVARFSSLTAADNVLEMPKSEDRGAGFGGGLPEEAQEEKPSEDPGPHFGRFA